MPKEVKTTFKELQKNNLQLQNSVKAFRKAHVSRMKPRKLSEYV